MPGMRQADEGHREKRHSRRRERRDDMAVQELEVHFREVVLMHCEWCGQTTSMGMGAHSHYSRCLCWQCSQNPEILRAIKEDFKRRRGR